MKKHATITLRPALKTLAGKLSPSSTRGIALVLTLGILAIVTLLVIAFATSMRVENMASKNFNDMIKARQLAQGAVDEAVALLRQGTPPQTNMATASSSSPVSFWTAPGLALKYENGAFASVPLYSANYPATEPNWVNLNANGVITGSNAVIAATGNAIYAGWVDVGRDPTTPPSSINPLIGRYAFWVDDEATKVNVNTAWERDPGPPSNTSTNNSVPSEIDLRALEGSLFNNGAIAQAIYTNANVAPNPRYSTEEEVRRAGLSADDYATNKFFMTVYSSDTNMDTWGRQRINLNNLGTLDVAVGSDVYNRLADTTYQNIYPSLASSGINNFVTKYGSGNVLQMLANIIDYRTNDSVDATYNTPLDPTLEVPTSYCGLKKGPFLNEIILHAMQTNAIISIVPSGPLLITNWTVFVRVFADVELINPFPVDLGAGYEVVVEPQSITYQIFQGQLGTPHRAHVGPVFTNWYPIAVGPPGAVIPVSLGALQPKTFPTNVMAYSYRTLSMTNYWGKAVTPPAENWQFVPMWEDNSQTFSGNGILANEVPGVTNVVVQLKRVVLRRTPGTASSVRDWATSVGPAGRTDLPVSTIPAALLWDLRQSIHTPIRDWLETAKTTVQDYDSNSVGFAKNDPRMRTFQNVPMLSTVTNWTPTFMSAGGGYRATPTDDNAKFIFEHKTQVFAPSLLPDGSERQGIPNVIDGLASTFYIKEARFESPGELGFIHTGVPWKTLRMQSSVANKNNVIANTIANPLNATAEAGSIPDWVLLDIFTATSAATVSGRLNINCSIFGSNNFDRTSANWLEPRADSLAALFYGMDNTPLSYPITTPTTGMIQPATNFWWGTKTFNSAAMDQLHPQPSFAFVDPRAYLADGLAEAHDPNLSQNARNLIFVTNNLAVPTYGYNTNILFLTPGEVTEVSGLDNALVAWDTGSGLAGPRKADKELIMRKIANLITTRSNAFTIWVIAQSIKDVDKNGVYTAGTDLITGEVRAQAVVERYEEAGTVKFRTKYFRYVYD